MLSHERSAAVYVLAVVLAGAFLVLVPRTRSRFLSLSAGAAAGGAVATLAAALVWQGGVPDPLVAHGFAFNVADVAIGAGDALLIGGVLVHVWTNRERLHERV